MENYEKDKFMASTSENNMEQVTKFVYKTRMFEFFKFSFYFNLFRNLSDTLFQILVELEEDTCYEYENKSYADKLLGTMAAYKVYIL